MRDSERSGAALPESVFVGTGGWGYFAGASGHKLRYYARQYNFVEVNCTFYQWPSRLAIAKWRRSVPTAFRFAVKCNRELTHIHELEPTDRAFTLLERMLKICELLGANVMVLQTPPWLQIDTGKIKSLRNFFASVQMKSPRFAWEARGRSRLNRELLGLLREYEIAPIIDLSKEAPDLESSILYSRIFGKGETSFSQLEKSKLRLIMSRGLESTAKEKFFSFHTLRMYQDALRFMALLTSKSQPAFTDAQTGQELFLLPATTPPSPLPESYGPVAMETPPFGFPQLRSKRSLPGP